MRLVLSGPRTQLSDGLFDAADVQTEMVVAAVVQTVGQIRVRSHFLGRRLTPAEYLDTESIVVGWGDVGELLVDVVPCRDNAEVELFDVEG